MTSSNEQLVPVEQCKNCFTPEAIERANVHVANLQANLDITNADHIALWLEEHLTDDTGLGWLACRIVEAHEAALRTPPAVEPDEGLVEIARRLWAEKEGNKGYQYLDGSRDEYPEMKELVEILSAAAPSIRAQALDEAAKGEAEAYLIERLSGKGYGSPRSVVDAQKYNPTLEAFWIEGARERHRVTALASVGAVLESAAKIADSHAVKAEDCDFADGYGKCASRIAASIRALKGGQGV